MPDAAPPHRSWSFKNPFAKKKRKQASSESQQADAEKLQSTDDLLADLHIGDEIGRGGFSIVKAVHRRGQDAGIVTAMKITSLELLESSMGISRAELKASLERMRKFSDANKNPHIISFIDWRMSKTELFTFGELCRGNDLFERLVNSPDGHYTEEQARGVARNLLQAVCDTHAAGIVHRDIKPENIFYRTKDSDPADIVLADYGGCIDEIWSPDHEMRGRVGSPGYLPPEIAAGHPYTMLVDEWSCGVTLYEVLTGRSPFVGDTPEQLVREVLDRAVPWPARYWRKLSPESRHFVQGLLQKDPKRRMSAAEGLKHPWLSPAPQRHDSYNSLMESETSESESEPAELTRVATRKSTVPPAAQFDRPDLAHCVCTACVLSKDKTAGIVMPKSGCPIPHGPLSPEDLQKLIKLEADPPATRDVEDSK